MVRKALKIAGWIVLVLLLLFAVQLWRNWDTVQRVFLGGLKVYETVPPELPAEIKRPAFLVFSKTNAFRHKEAIPAAAKMFEVLAQEKGWGIYQTENGAAFTPEILARFDAVVFSNASGDVFTPDQRKAFQTFLESGGGYLGIHAAGDNSHKDWDWYMTGIIGATFTQHTMDPQFQEALVVTEDKAHPATQGLPASWRRIEEWYSFDKSPRKTGAHVLITVDESTYNPVGMYGKDLRMGDHPMVWARCVGAEGTKRGRVLYSAFGHRAEAFAEPEHQRLLANGLAWAMRLNGSECDAPSAAPTPEAKP
jgi:uncharacterized protein